MGVFLLLSLSLSACVCKYLLMIHRDWQSALGHLLLTKRKGEEKILNCWPLLIAVNLHWLMMGKNRKMSTITCDWFHPMASSLPQLIHPHFSSFVVVYDLWSWDYLRIAKQWKSQQSFRCCDDSFLRTQQLIIILILILLKYCYSY